MSINPENICKDLKVLDENPSDKLEKMFEMQQSLQEALGSIKAGLPIEERTALIKDMILATTDELHELLARFPWKPWKSYVGFSKTEDGWKETRMEVVDIFHFFMNLCILVDLTPKDLYNYYTSKNQENFDRIKRGYSKSR